MAISNDVDSILARSCVSGWEKANAIKNSLNKSWWLCELLNQLLFVFPLCSNLKEITNLARWCPICLATILLPYLLKLHWRNNTEPCGSWFINLIPNLAQMLWLVIFIYPLLSVNKIMSCWKITAVEYLEDVFSYGAPSV